jgi:hypothetical protein
VIKIDPGINDPCPFADPVPITYSFNIPGDQSGFNYCKAIAEGNDPVWFNSLNIFILA